MRFNEITRLIKTAIDLERAAKKQEEVDRLTASDLNYGIVRDLINSATFGVRIELTMRDGTKLLIERDDPLTKQQIPYPEGF